MTDGPARAFPPWLPWTIAAVLLSAWVARVPLEGIPHVSDEIAYTLQSRLFAAGVRVGPPGDQPSMLAYPFWVSDGASFSPFSPGWPPCSPWAGRGPHGPQPPAGRALLRAPVAAGAGVGRRAHRDPRDRHRRVQPRGRDPGRLSDGHTSVLVALAALLLVVAPTAWAWWLAGAAAGYVVLARPFDAALLAGPMLAWGLWRRARAPDRRPSSCWAWWRPRAGRGPPAGRQRRPDGRRAHLPMQAL